MQPDRAVALAPGAEVVVTLADMFDNRLVWTVEDDLGLPYHVYADELQLAGKRSTVVPVGVWRDDPNALFFQLEKPVTTEARESLPAGTRVKWATTSICRSAADADLIGIWLYPGGKQHGAAEAARGVLLDALSRVSGSLRPDVRVAITGASRFCPSK